MRATRKFVLDTYGTQALGTLIVDAAIVCIHILHMQTFLRPSSVHQMGAIKRAETFAYEIHVYKQSLCQRSK